MTTWFRGGKAAPTLSREHAARLERDRAKWLAAQKPPATPPSRGSVSAKVFIPSSQYASFSS